MKRLLAALALSILSALVGCSDSTNAVLQTVGHAMPGGAGGEGASLDPRFRYLRVTVEERVAFPALGYVDGHPRGRVEVWYSSGKEVMRLQDGRVVGLAGVAFEWRNVEIAPLPSWAELARTQVPLRWVRVRDVMPGYHYGIRDQLLLARIPPPARSALRGIEADRLAWFEEVMEGSSLTGEKLPPARYGVQVVGGVGTVVYGEQCIAREFCLAWQRWPAGT
jgi:hypothetical protein